MLLFTKEELADIAKVETRTVYAWVHSGRLRALKPGGRLLRFRADDVETFLGLPPGSLQRAPAERR